jgi:LEA14-like dessication related protein
MKNFEKNILLFLLLPLLSSCSPKMPEYLRTKNFSISGFGLKKSAVSAEIYYYNPNRFGLQLQRVEADVFVSGRKIGHTIMDTTITIRARDSFALPVKMDVEMMALFPNAVEALLKKELKLKVEGRALIRKNGLRFPWPIQYEEMQKW